MYYISKYLHIENGFIFENGNKTFSHQEDFPIFIKEAYKNFVQAYPKFYKMDDLCKLAFLGSEMLLKNELEKDIALLFSNNEGSLDTDIKHQHTIQTAENYYPSPALFVYTLPNIAIGEVSIRHQLKSESAFFIAHAFQADYMHSYTQYLLQNNKAEKVVCAWIHFLNGSYKAIFYLVEKKGELKHNIEQVKKIIKWKL